MLLENLDLIICIMATVIGVFAVIMFWIHIIESARGVEVVEFNTYKNYVNLAYLISLLLLGFEWLTATALSMLITKILICFFIVWIATPLIALLVSIFLKSARDAKDIRSTIPFCIIKAFFIILTIWIVK